MRVHNNLSLIHKWLTQSWMKSVMKRKNFELKVELFYKWPAYTTSFNIFSYWIAGIFLASVAGVAAIAGFSKTLATSKRQEQVLVEKGVIENVRLLDAGSSLAMRALGWGTFCAFLGTFTFSYGVWKLSGATNVCLIVVLGGYIM